MNTATNVLLVSFKSFEKRFFSHQIFFLATERSKVIGTLCGEKQEEVENIYGDTSTH